MNSQNILQQINAEAKFIENSIGYQKTKIGTIPKDWKVKKLKDISNRVQRKNDGKSHNVLTISSKGGFLNQTERFSKVIAGENLAKYILLRKNEFAYNKGNSKTYPYGCIYRLEDYEEALVPNVYYCFEIREGVTEFYKHYFIAGKLNKFLARVINTGVRNDGLLNLNVTDFFDVPVAAPPIKEQQKIASILSTWDKAIELKEKLIEQKKQQKKGLMQKLLTGEVRLPGFEGKWRSLRILNFCNTYSGGTPSRTRKEFYENGTIPWIKSGELNSRKVTQTEEYITEKALANSTAKLVNPETILLALYGATAGVVAMSKIRASINQAILAIVPNDNCDNNFLFYYLENHMDKVTKKYTQGGQPNLNADIVKKMVVKLPSIEEQKAIANILSNIDNNIELLEKELNGLKQQKKGLMQLLLTGKVRVKV
ncbi:MULTISPECIES: restriction endonuclease subunit S [Heyndrickxia]|jgi:type I restriction enzyme S subunit|uniref:restriction endonuclease subunit S n=2 Tax=Bacillaceae TaxID=186817 RepID=UPI0007796944|nr:MULTISPECIES: restriction endonuclease subunit S [Heyndrickxia]AVD55617.1 restriction endonuclease subunit S [Heyndrickxia coagulans]AWP36506.1 restriction endonuclease subunit S [Heyndrickxia coagulans]KYC63208.1 Type I restriction-modification system, specificity subunit S [Heyndrickxia coagulans]MEC2305939.1 restriction endonuclease subunit S [Weizmannia sp. CD-2023]MEC2339333.1 restriction endonuclease subunit S [Weizmannia sp. CD-2023]